MESERESTEVRKLELLRLMLQVAVPVWIERLRELPFETVLERARTCGELVAGPAGADILYRSKAAGGTATAFNALAEGVACLAFSPGGVRIFGLHFEASRSNFSLDEAGERVALRARAAGALAESGIFPLIDERKS